MITRFVLVLSYHDGSGIVQAFGPYDTIADAEAAQGELQAMPALGLAGCRWEALPCVDFGQPSSRSDP